MVTGTDDKKYVYDASPTKKLVPLVNEADKVILVPGGKLKVFNGDSISSVNIVKALE